MSAEQAMQEVVTTQQELSKAIKKDSAYLPAVRYRAKVAYTHYTNPFGADKYAR